MIRELQTRERNHQKAILLGSRNIKYHLKPEKDKSCPEIVT